MIDRETNEAGETRQAGQKRALGVLIIDVWVNNEGEGEGELRGRRDSRESLSQKRLIELRNINYSI